MTPGCPRCHSRWTSMSREDRKGATLSAWTYQCGDCAQWYTVETIVRPVSGPEQS